MGHTPTGFDPVYRYYFAIVSMSLYTIVNRKNKFSLKRDICYMAFFIISQYVKIQNNDIKERVRRGDRRRAINAVPKVLQSMP